MELGVNAPSLFEWVEQFNGKQDRLRETVYRGAKACDYIIHTYTVAELGAMLPANIEYEFNQCYVSSNKSCAGDSYYCNICIIGGSTLMYDLERPTEAAARAAMLIHLLEQNLITAEECNKRINNN